MIASTFGTPFTYPGQFSPWGISQQGLQGLANNPYGFQPYLQSPPLVSAPLSSISQARHLLRVSRVLQQVVLPLLQIVPQQLQHLQQLASVQLQELQRLQQVVQLLAGQVNSTAVAVPAAAVRAKYGSRGAALGNRAHHLRDTTESGDVADDGNVDRHGLRQD